MRNLTIVPASAGWFCLEPDYDNELRTVIGFTKEPIIAWRMESELGDAEEWLTIVTPITVCGCWSGHKGHSPILHPSGRIEVLGEIDFNDMAELLKWVNSVDG